MAATANLVILKILLNQQKLKKSNKKLITNAGYEGLDSNISPSPIKYFCNSFGDEAKLKRSRGG